MPHRNLALAHNDPSLSDEQRRAALAEYRRAVGRTGGRPRGPSSRLPAAEFRTETERNMRDALGGATFEGDAYALLQLVYRSPCFPIRVRINAAETCLKYERPMLQAIAVRQDRGSDSIAAVLSELLKGTGRGLPSEGFAEVGEPIGAISSVD